tara:strand:+ start:200 stop:376 length:177 start_codon:yes stop_codon:yes gene_type:complete
MTLEEIENKLKIQEAIDAMHNHELYLHTVVDNTSLILSIVNTIVLIYVIYKLNTNKTR